MYRWRGYLYCGKSKTFDAIVSCPTYKDAVDMIVPYLLTMHNEDEDMKIIIKRVKI